MGYKSFDQELMLHVGRTEEVQEMDRTKGIS